MLPFFLASTLYQLSPGVAARRGSNNHGVGILPFPVTYAAWPKCRKHTVNLNIYTEPLSGSCTSPVSP